MNVLSLFSGCGGMDIGFEGGFSCLKRSIKSVLHPDWIEKDNGITVSLTETGFHTVFANDILVLYQEMILFIDTQYQSNVIYSTADFSFSNLKQKIAARSSKRAAIFYSCSVSSVL